MEGKRGCLGGEDVDRVVVVKALEVEAVKRELEEAVALGEAPKLEGVKFEVTNHWVDEKKSWLRTHLRLILDGQLVEVVDERVIEEKEKNGHAYDGELGSFDLMKGVLGEALRKRWPEIEQYLNEVRVEGYCAFESEFDRSHHIQISFKVAFNKDEALRPVKSEGVDTIGKTRLTLITIYHLVAWRLLRRLRGEKRARGEC